MPSIQLGIAFLVISLLFSGTFAPTAFFTRCRHSTTASSSSTPPETSLLEVRNCAKALSSF